MAIRFLSVFLLLIKFVQAQSVSTTLGARALGLGNAATTLSDEWSLMNNVGGLAGVKELSAAFAFEARPALPGSSRVAATVNAPTKFGTAGLGMFRFGDQVYSEQVLTAGFANQFGIASLGLKVNYIQYRAEGYGTKSGVSINFGGIAQLTPQVAVGAYIVNINQPKISTPDKEKIPTKLAAGVSFRPAEQILLVAELEKDVDYKPTWKGALEFKVHAKVSARTGFNVGPGAAFIGLGFQGWRIKIDYAIQYSNALNFAHQASASYRLQKKKETAK